MPFLYSIIFWGWQVLDLNFLEVGRYRTLFISGIWHTGKFGVGKDETMAPMNNIINLGAMDTDKLI